MTTRLPTEDRRAQITEAALQLIAARGIAALSTSELARAVGLTSGALFRHFPSLDAILDAVADRVAELLASTYPPAGLAPLDRLGQFFDARHAMAVERAGIPRLVLSEQFAHALPEGARRTLQRAVDDTLAFVRDAIADGQREGVIRNDLPAETLGVLVMGALQMAVMSHRIGRRERVRAEAVRDVVLAVLAPNGGQRARRKR